MQASEIRSLRRWVEALVGLLAVSADDDSQLLRGVLYTGAAP